VLLLQTNHDSVAQITVCSLGAFLLIIKTILFFRAMFLTFARFVGGFLVILKKLMPFLIVSLLLVIAFIYCFMVTRNPNCIVNGTPDFPSCAIWTVGILFEFQFGVEGSNRIVGAFFTLIILIVLLNVVIAIVSDAWNTHTASDLSTQLFWKYRLEMMTLLNGFADLDQKLECQRRLKGRMALPNGDFLWHASFGSNSRTFWTDPPYNLVTEKKKYDKPHEYFKAEVADQINMAKSLNADLYWSNREKGESLTGAEKFRIICVWLITVTLYYFLVILGFFLFGLPWPEKFRRALLNLNSL